MELPETRYADAAGVRIAYQEFGSGPQTMCIVTNWGSNIEAIWQLDDWADWAWRMARDFRVLIFDHRGTGASDRVPKALSPDDQARDIGAVLDAAGVENVVLLAVDTATVPALNFAALHPERTSAVVLLAPTAKSRAGDGYPHGLSPEAGARSAELIEGGWGQPDSSYNHVMLPGPEQARRRVQLARVQRLAIDPSEVAALVEHWAALDGRAAAAHVTAPTLILHSVDDPLIPVEHARWLAAHLPNARLEEVDGSEHFLWADHRNLVVRRVLEFVLGDGARPGEQVVLALVMTDIVGSTEHANALGAERWRELLERHDTGVRRLLARFGGTENSTAGDSFFATFASVGAATRFALAAADNAATLGLRLRVGVHVADVDNEDGEAHGFGVHVTARVQAAAEAGDVLVTGGVRDGLLGTGDLDFAPAGEHDFKGVPGRWQLWRARQS
ncbi:MAG: hypothetical protein QOJ79_2220 [Actinomycetota bacterium]|nr:hypothetical protein [Actinomycetota bacterium]